MGGRFVSPRWNSHESEGSRSKDVNVGTGLRVGAFELGVREAVQLDRQVTRVANRMRQVVAFAVVLEIEYLAVVVVIGEFAETMLTVHE